MLQLSQRVKQLHASPIREILSVIKRPGMVSFAGGLPAQASFTLPDFSTMPAEYLQYGPSEGEPTLRKLLCEELTALGLDCEPEQVLVLSGSQQGIDLLAKLMIDQGTLVALENPTYLAALQVFRFFGARFTTLQPSAPADMANGAELPRLCYVIPTFQNPSAYCYTQAERQQLAEVCMQKDILLFEDDPYRDLMYEPCDRQPICSFMSRGSWVYQGSFSKSLAPGLRLGFMVCSKNLITPLTRLKQAADLHSNRLSQYWVMQQLQDAKRKIRILELQTLYRSKRDAFNNALNQTMSQLAHWEVPQGGLFFWLRLQQQLDTSLLLQKALEQNLAIMPGEPFFHSKEHTGNSYLRLNFSHAEPAEMQSGLQILASLLG